MELTGNCKEKFEYWFLLNNDHITLSERFYEEFLEFPFYMQYGLYVDFFDSVGYCISNCYLDDLFKDRYYSEITDAKGNTIKDYSEDSREKALTKSFKKANELFNIK